MLALLYLICYNASGVPHKLQKGVCKIARLAEIRKARGVTQERLAELTGVHRVTIARIETGEVSPKAETLKRLADALGVYVDDLMSQKAG